ncbi:hypothetical protein LguiA_025916 [Lonicera macranthoides]
MGCDTHRPEIIPLYLYLGTTSAAYWKLVKYAAVGGKRYPALAVEAAIKAKTTQVPDLRCKQGELEGHLSRDWPDLSGRQTPKGQEFWKHEWNIHGTCSDNYYNQFQYFILAPKFRQHYHLRQILENGNIHCCMGYAYTAQHIQKAIFDSTGYYPDLRCQLAQLAGGNRLLLVEIIICLDIKNLQVIDCPYPSTSCIYYPHVRRRRCRGCRPRPMSVTY